MIKIEVITCNGLPPPQPICAEFDELGGNIGRAEDNTLVLPDPDKHISRIHATIEFRAGKFFICNHGSAMPVFLNGKPLAREQSELIKAGDEICIGGYTLQVMADDRSPNSLFEEASAPSNKKSLLEPAAFAKSDIFADLDEHLPQADEENKSKKAEGILPFTDFSSTSDSSAKSKHQASSEIIPEDFNPFADLPDSDGLSKDLQSKDKKNQLADEPESSTAESDINPFIDTKSPLDELSIQSKDKSIDPLVIVDDASKKKAQEFHIQRDDAPELNSPFKPPQPKKETKTNQDQQPQPQPQPIPVDSSKQKSSSESQALLHAFLAGAGMQNREAPFELTPEFMHLIGQLLRESTKGAVELLLARSLTKQEIRANVTLIAPKENNPLKFSPDVETALAHLLGPQSRGFMSPQQAIKDAYDDLRSHQFGFMAGMRAALENVFERFSPQKLDQRLTKKTTLDTLIPINRKAKLWDAYTERYEEISKEAEEDFHVLFGKAFLRAYEAQIAKLKDENQ